MAGVQWPTAGVVDVWVAPLDVVDPVLAALVASLSRAERVRARRHRDPKDARRFSAARGWLRHVLGAAVGVPAAEVDLSSGPGKPWLTDRSSPYFNVSHAGELALIAVADHEVGVDVEHGDSALHGLDAAGVACSEREAAALRRLAPAAQARAFLRLWTAKEAYLKATGLGLSVPPASVEPASMEAAGPVAVHVAGTPSGWWVERLEPAPAYVAAVAAQGRAWSVRLHPITAVDDCTAHAKRGPFRGPSS